MNVYCWNNACPRYGQGIYVSNSLDLDYVLDHRCTTCDMFSLHADRDPQEDELHPKNIAAWLNDQDHRLKYWDTDALILCRLYADWKRGVIEYDPEGV